MDHVPPVAALLPHVVRHIEAGSVQLAAASSQSITAESSAVAGEMPEVVVSAKRGET
jgi:hypothetical protein